jgi:hypothetical protein
MGCKLKFASVAKKRCVANQKMENEPNFFRLRPIHNIRKNKELQQKINNGHLAKTNPISSALPNARRRTKKCQTKPIFERQKQT